MHEYQSLSENNFLADFTVLKAVIDFIKQICRQNRHFSDRLFGKRNRKRAIWDRCKLTGESDQWLTLATRAVKHSRR
jgi:hypothetical protein